MLGMPGHVRGFLHVWNGVWRLHDVPLPLLDRPRHCKLLQGVCKPHLSSTPYAVCACVVCGRQSVKKETSGNKAGEISMRARQFKG